MNDLLGIGKGTDKLLDVISKACGVVYKPVAQRKEADAEAYRLKAVGHAKAESKANELVTVAQAKAEVRLIEAEAQATLAERARMRAEHREAQKQSNLENAFQFAAMHMEDEVSQDQVDPDWIDIWTEHAQHVSSEFMQEIWGRVLAGEVARPGSYSSKALATLKSMTLMEAKALQTACSLACGWPKTQERFIVSGLARTRFPHVLFLGIDNEIKLNKYDLAPPTCMMLQRCGIIYEDSLLLGTPTCGAEMTIEYHDVALKLVAKLGGPQLINFKFTPVGDELARLVKPLKNETYLGELVKTLKSGFNITKVAAHCQDATSG
ncbi:MAG: TIGR03899 family protein [Desulfurivibrionaceae bacterium]